VSTSNRCAKNGKVACVASRACRLFAAWRLLRQIRSFKWPGSVERGLVWSLRIDWSEQTGDRRHQSLRVGVMLRRTLGCLVGRALIRQTRQ